MQRLASISKLSIHTIQSIAYGRRAPSAPSEKKLARALWRCGWDL